MAVIVDEAHEARADVINDLEELRVEKFKEASGEFVRICQEIDSDQSGQVSLDELETGYDDNPEFKQILEEMGLRRHDLALVFHMMDSDGSGEVDYYEFGEELLRMRSHDMHMLLIFIKLYVFDIREKISSRIGVLENNIGQQIEVLQRQSSLMTRAAPEEFLAGDPSPKRSVEIKPPACPREIPDATVDLAYFRDEFRLLLQSVRDDITHLSLRHVAAMSNASATEAHLRFDPETKLGSVDLPEMRSVRPESLHGTAPASELNGSTWSVPRCCSLERAQQQQPVDAIGSSDWSQTRDLLWAQRPKS